jgi:bifunctional non-homologous end joining protein LigD
VTEGGEMRHPVFLGLRTDKPAAEVVREKPKPLKAAKPKTKARAK